MCSLNLPPTGASTAAPVRSASPREWGAVLALSLGAFALVASEFMPVSLLTPIATDLHVSEGQAGQAIAVSGGFALVTSLLVSPLAGQLDRKWLLLGLTTAMILSGTLAALAPSFPVFMLGRALIGVAIGGFWAMSAATAMRLVPSHQVPRALAIVNGGNALATVIAAPMGSYFGAIIGWRGAFFSLVPVAVVALLWKIAALPSMKATAGRASWNVFALLKRPPVAWGMAGVSLFFMGQFSLFTYLRPFVEGTLHVSPSTLSLLLLLMGAAGLAGTLLIEPFVHKALFRTLVLLPALMAVVAVCMILLGNTLPRVAVLFALWGLLGTSAPVAWWSWLARTLPDDGEAGGGLMVAVVQMAIAVGATVGGLLLDHQGYRATFWFSAVLLLGSVVTSCIAARSAQHHRLPVHT
ncbi:TPA: MFS transporter [Stenotrophomonas maltophilia]|nr:MFS transporter [Stenotrophomonas maltophilia]